MVPFLSLLLGVPIPQNNLGVLPHWALRFLTDRQKLQWMFLNLHQLLHVYELNQNTQTNGKWSVNSSLYRTLYWSYVSLSSHIFAFPPVMWCLWLVVLVTDSIEYSRLLEQHSAWLEQHEQGVLHEHTLHQLAMKLLLCYHSFMIQLRSDIAGSLTTYDMHAMLMAIVIVWSVSKRCLPFTNTVCFSRLWYKF